MQKIKVKRVRKGNGTTYRTTYEWEGQEPSPTQRIECQQAMNSSLTDHATFVGSSDGRHVYAE